MDKAFHEISANGEVPSDDFTSVVSDAMTRVAIVGYGYLGSKHARVSANIPSIELMTVDSNPERLQEARGAFPGGLRPVDALGSHRPEHS